MTGAMGVDRYENVGGQKTGFHFIDVTEIVLEIAKNSFTDIITNSHNNIKWT